MDSINFDFELKRMKKRKILILKEIIFELYAFERNKYQLSKLVGITPQAIGPIVDLLKEVELIQISREERKRKIPAFFYKFDLKSSISEINLADSEKEILLELMNRFQPIYAELKELENENRIEQTIENFYEGIVPNTAKMFILQVISSLLILASLILDIEFLNVNPFFSPGFLKSHPNFLSQLEHYKNELNSKLSPIPQDLEDFISYNLKEIEVIYNKIWTELLQLVMFESIMKEPSVNLKRIVESKESTELNKKKLKKLIENFKDYSKKKLKDVLNDENIQRNTNIKDFNITQKKITEIMDKILDDRKLTTELNDIYNKMNSFMNKIKTLPIGITRMEKDKDKLEFLNDKIAIEKAISNIISGIFDDLQKMEKEIQFEGSNIVSIKKEINKKLQDIELLMKWVENPRELFLDAPKKSKINKKEVRRKLSELLQDFKETSVISEDDLIREFREFHPNLDVNAKILKSILVKMVKEKIILGMEKIKSGKKNITVYILRETNEDQQKIYELAKHSPSGKVTIPRIVDNFGWSEVKARYILGILKENGHVEYRYTKSEGETWFIPAIMED
ncbi:MAG: hypothetical protein ACTSVY_11825 [Candidatus Helarchaeota archaeon]